MLPNRTINYNNSQTVQTNHHIRTPLEIVQRFFEQSSRFFTWRSAPRRMRPRRRLILCDLRLIFLDIRLIIAAWNWFFLHKVDFCSQRLIFWHKVDFCGQKLIFFDMRLFFAVSLNFLRWKMTGSLWRWWWTACSCGFSLSLSLVISPHRNKAHDPF